MKSSYYKSLLFLFFGSVGIYSADAQRSPERRPQAEQRNMSAGNSAPRFQQQPRPNNPSISRPVRENSPASRPAQVYHQPQTGNQTPRTVRPQGTFNHQANPEATSVPRPTTRPQGTFNPNGQAGNSGPIVRPTPVRPTPAPVNNRPPVNNGSAYNGNNRPGVSPVNPANAGYGRGGYNNNSYHHYNGNNYYNNSYYNYNNRPNVSYNAYNPSWRYNYYPRRNTIVRVFPFSYSTINYGGFGYRYYDGLWYQPYDDYFRVVSPPFGIFINTLPLGYRRIYVGSDPYYYYNGTYYSEQAEQKYTVVAPPVGAIVESIPEGYETVVVDGETYYKVDNVQYKPVVQDSGEIWYQVIKVG